MIRCCSPIILILLIIMDTNEFVKYVTPAVEIIEVEVERGFEGSTGGTGENMGWG